jgi:hypothetical protein
MSKLGSPPSQTKSKHKKWLINLLILILVTVLMLALAEGVMRWLDGYKLSTLELDQDTTIQTVE